jgi:hypothetical protein
MREKGGKEIEIRNKLFPSEFRRNSLCVSVCVCVYRPTYIYIHLAIQPIIHFEKICNSGLEALFEREE